MHGLLLCVLVTIYQSSTLKCSWFCCILTQVRCIIRNIVRDWAAEVTVFLFVMLMYSDSFINRLFRTWLVSYSFFFLLLGSERTRPVLQAYPWRAWFLVSWSSEEEVHRASDILLSLWAPLTELIIWFAAPLLAV